MLEHNYHEIRQRFGLPVLPATNIQLDQLHAELDSYFKGKLNRFTVPLAISGTPFQERGTALNYFSSLVERRYLIRSWRSVLVM